MCLLASFARSSKFVRRLESLLRMSELDFFLTFLLLQDTTRHRKTFIVLSYPVLKPTMFKKCYLPRFWVCVWKEHY